MTSASPSSPPTSRSSRSSWPGPSRKRGFESLFVPEHTHIPVTRIGPPYPAASRCPRSTFRDPRPVRRARRDRRGHDRPRRRHGHLPRRPARPDRPRQAGRLARHDLERAVRLRQSATAGNVDERTTRRGVRRTVARSCASACWRWSRSGRTRWRRSPGRTCSSPIPMPWPKTVQQPAAAGARRRCPPVRSCSATSPSTPTGGSRSAGVASPRTCRSCRRRSRRPGAIRSRCASPCSAPRPTRASSSTTARWASSASCCGSRRRRPTRVLPILGQVRRSFVRMRFGVCVPQSGRFLDAAVQRRLATEIESIGFDSLWVSDHVIVPVGEGYTRGDARAAGAAGVAGGGDVDDHARHLGAGDPIPRPRLHREVPVVGRRALGRTARARRRRRLARGRVRRAVGRRTPSAARRPTSTSASSANLGRRRRRPSTGAGSTTRTCACSRRRTARAWGRSRSSSAATPRRRCAAPVSWAMAGTRST